MKSKITEADLYATTEVGCMIREFNHQCVQAARAGDDVEMRRYSDLSSQVQDALLEFNRLRDEQTPQSNTGVSPEEGVSPGIQE